MGGGIRGSVGKERGSAVRAANRILFCGGLSLQVIIIRYEGPQGGPGMPEMLTPTSAIMGAGLGDVVCSCPLT